MKVKLSRKVFQIPQKTDPEARRDLDKLVSLFPRGISKYTPSSEVYIEPPLIDHNLYIGRLADLRKDLLLHSFLSKAPFLKGTSPREKAIESFRLAEDQCYRTNKFLRSLARDPTQDPALNAVLFTAQRKIARILGPYTFEAALTLSKWGPGSTSSCKGSQVSSSDKFAAKPETTPQFSRIAHRMMAECPSWSALLADCDLGVPVSPILYDIKGSRVSFVPKNAKTHRAICVEPHLNVFFQMGIGRLIRRQLLRSGLDLNDQTLNQRLAKHGSLDGSLATIDLKAASDTISRELVLQLLPFDWFAAMDECRSHYGSLDGKEYFLFNKFSSMGNGFTFDLESLIFYALCLSVAELEDINPFWVNVFGDDIVFPTVGVPRLIEVLQKCGFTTNTEKSFSSGPFRESCGQDFFFGQPVRSVFLKELPTTPVAWIKIANSIRRLSLQWGDHKHCCQSLKKAYDFAVSRIPKDFRYKIPDGFGDGGLIVNIDEASPTPVRNGWEGYYFQHLTSSPLVKITQSRALITAGVHTIGQTGNRIPLRDKFVLKKATSIAQVWRNLGPWAASS